MYFIFITNFVKYTWRVLVLLILCRKSLLITNNFKKFKIAVVKCTLTSSFEPIVYIYIDCQT